MLLAWRVTTLSAIKTQRGWHKWGVGVVVEREPKKSSTTSAGLTEAVPFHSTLYKRMALLHHCTGRSFSSPWVLLYVSRKCLVWCKRLSKKVKIRIIIIKKKNWRNRHRKATKHKLFLSIPAHKTSLFRFLYRIFFFFHVHQQKKYIHSSHLGTSFFFFSFFLYTKKLQKSSKKHHWIGL